MNTPPAPSLDGEYTVRTVNDATMPGRVHTFPDGYGYQVVKEVSFTISGGAAELRVLTSMFRRISPGRPLVEGGWVDTIRPKYQQKGSFVTFERQMAATRIDSARVMADRSLVVYGNLMSDAGQYEPYGIPVVYIFDRRE